MLALLLLKRCNAFSSCFSTETASDGGNQPAHYLSRTPARPTSPPPINLIKQVPLARQKNN